MCLEANKLFSQAVFEQHNYVFDFPSEFSSTYGKLSHKLVRLSIDAIYIRLHLSNIPTVEVVPCSINSKLFKRT